MSGALWSAASLPVGVAALVVQAVLCALGTAALVAAGPFLAGLFAGGWGDGRVASPLAGLRRLRRLARKPATVPEGAPALFLLAVAAEFASLALAALLVPSFLEGVAAPADDVVLVLGLLGLARASASAGAFAAGTAPAGRAASRRLALATLALPGLLVGVLTLAQLAGATGLGRVASVGWGAGWLALPGLLPAALIDLGGADARAQHSGRALALLDVNAALRLLVWLDLLAAILLPWGMAAAGGGLGAWAIGLLAWAAKLAVLAPVLCGLAHLRPAVWPRALAAALLLALLGVLAAVLAEGFA